MSKNAKINEDQGFDSLLQDSYSLLRKVAQNQLNKNQNLTLSATELVHEFYLKASHQEDLGVENRKHFVSVAAQCMKWLIMDYAKSKHREKRGGAGPKIQFDENVHGQPAVAEAVELVQALDELEKISLRARQVAEMRYLLGLEILETAEQLGISEATVKREWKFAQSWLARELFEKKGEE